MMPDIAKDNSLAIFELNQGNEAIAQAMLRKNAKKAPCCMTLNNLGVFYSQYGMLIKNDKFRSAAKIGLKHLKKASLYGNDWRNYVSTATALWESGDISLALEFLEKAYQINKDSLIRYNIGACLFRMQKYEEAASAFKELCSYKDIELITRNGGQNPYIILAYCEERLSDKSKCIEYFQTYCNAWKEDLFDVFCLKYLCGMYKDALSESAELLKEWYLTDTLLAMIVDCSLKVSLPEKSMAIPSEKRKILDILKRNSVFRMQKIHEYSYLPPLICMYQFISF